MKLWKRFAIIIALFFLFTCMMTVGVWATNIVAERNEYPTWKLTDDGTLFIGDGGTLDYKYDGGIMNLDEYASYVKRIVIKHGAVDLYTSLDYIFPNCTEIIIPESVESICWRFFSGRSNVESITIPKSVKIWSNLRYEWSGIETSIKNLYVDDENPYLKSIDGVLFSKDGTTLISYPNGRNDKSYIIPSFVTNIEAGAFNGAKYLEKIVIPESVKIIGESAFEGCVALKHLTLPKNVEQFYVGYTSFLRCDSLEAIYVDKENQYYSSEAGILFSKDKEVIIKFPPAMKKNTYIIPETVKRIANGAFSFCSGIKNLVIPENVEFIEADGIANSDTLEKVFISAFTKLDERALGYDAQYCSVCPNLTVFGFYNSDTHKKADYYVSTNQIKFVLLNEEYYRHALNGYFLKGSFQNGISYTLGLDYVLTFSGTGAIPDFAAGQAPWQEYADKIHKVVIEEGITGIGACSFYYCTSLYGVSLPESLTTIGYSAFSGCTALTGFTVPANVTSIGDNAFFGCINIKVIHLFPGVVYIGSRAFEGCTALREIDLPDTITYMGDYAFSGCTALTRVVIPVGVTELRPYVFNGCINITVVIIHSKVAVIDYNAFCGCKCHIHGYTGSYAKHYADSLGFTFEPLQFIWTVNSEWGTPELKKADEIRIFPGSLKEKDLSQSITREEFAEISVKVYEALTGTKTLPIAENPFDDTSDVEVLKAYNLGITTGVSENKFAPNSLLTREQAATMLTRVFKKATVPGWTVANDRDYPLTYDVPTAYWDHDKISDWAIESVYFMTANGIINGVGNNLFAPKNTTTEEEASGYANTTREQALVIAVRMAEKLAA